MQQHVVLAAGRLHHRQILVRRHGDADAGHDRLDDHFGDAGGTFAEDCGLDRLGAGDAAVRVLQAERAAVAGRRRDVDELARIRLELGLAVAHAAGGERRQRRAVIGVVAADGLEFELLGKFVLHILPRDLEAGLVGLGARVDEIGVVAAAHQRVDLVAELRRRNVHRGVRIIGDLLHLLGGDLGELGAAVADVDAPQPRHRVEIFGAVVVDHRGALRAGDHELLLLQRAVLHDRVQHRVEVLLDDTRALFRIGGVHDGHDEPLFIYCCGFLDRSARHGQTEPGLGGGSARFFALRRAVSIAATTGRCLQPMICRTAEAMMRTRSLLAVSPAALWLSSVIPAHAACVAPGFNPGGNFCNGCKCEGAMSVTRDQVCERPYDSQRLKSDRIPRPPRARPRKAWRCRSEWHDLRVCAGQGLCRA